MIDLHMHSTASDGTDSVKELLENVRASGINVFSLTDHDTIDGAVEMEKIVPKDMIFFPGIEFSSKTDAGKCHILAFAYDRDSEAFKKILQKGRDKRREKLDKRIAFIKDNFGIEFPKETLDELHRMGSVGKPHLGNLLVSMGYAENKDEAIKKYINPSGTESDRLDGKEVIQAVLSSGGIPVWAHPFGGTDEKEVRGEAFENQLKTLLDAGIMGLECYYSKYSAAEVKELVTRAQSHGLLISGGSDYHGKNKTVALGTLNSYGERIDREKLTLYQELIRRRTIEVKSK